MAAGKSPEPQTGYRAFVGNLPFEATEADLEELFSEYGTVVSVNIMRDDDGRARGFGFVNMETKEEGEAAVAALNGQELHGRPLNVSEGKAPAGRGRGRGDGRGRGRGRGDGQGRGRFDGRGRGRGDGRGRGSDFS